MTSSAAPPRVRCRQIGENDLGRVIDLLRQGFPGRSRRYWARGFTRQAARALPADIPRFGFLLESEGSLVGVILLLYTALGAGPQAELRCNLSSWYVDPEFRSQASLLIFAALRRKDVTYVNISPAPHTWSTIEAQGFTRYASGQFFALPALRRGLPGCRLVRIRPDSDADRLLSMPEHQLLADHAAMGCLSLVIEAPDGFHPFVFGPVRIRAGRVPLPMRQLVYCRNVADYVRFAGPIGRFLLRRGVPAVVHDANRPERGLVGYFRQVMGPKYFRGPRAPRLGDLAYTERVLFGP